VADLTLSAGLGSLTVSAPSRLFSGGALSPSQSAGVWVEVETRQLNEKLGRFLEVLQRDASQTVRTVALELLRRIQMRTPVDTGRCKNSFHMVQPGTPVDVFAYADNHGKGFDGSLSDASTGDTEAVVGTDVEYAIFLERGHSRQAPYGMVALSVAELTGALEAKMQQVIQQAARASGE
jgi:hypothetical protein